MIVPLNDCGRTVSLWLTSVSSHGHEFALHFYVEADKNALRHQVLNRALLRGALKGELQLGREYCASNEKTKMELMCDWRSMSSRTPQVLLHFLTSHPSSRHG
jgi:hypothetical protein